MSQFLTNAVSLDGAFSVSAARVNSRGSLATAAISRGATKMSDGDYSGAVREFQLATSYDPQSVTAFRYMGHAYASLGDASHMIASYEKAVGVDPTDATARAELAMSYLSVGRENDAEREYLRLARQSPSDTGPISSLGYLYVKQGRFAEADTQFRKLQQLAPTSASTFQALGALAGAQERFDDAASWYERAVSIAPSNAQAVADLGFAYLSLGDTERATAQSERLRDLNTATSVSLAIDLEVAMFTPEIAFIDPGRSTFLSSLGPKTPLTTLDPTLDQPNESHTFRMAFVFNQAMDAASVQSPYNWSITPAAGGDAGFYNFGLGAAPGTEARILPVPLRVSYDPETREAIVYFDVRQNATGDAVIDPSHWVFQFRGTDAAGNRVDPRGDQYSGSARTIF